MQGEDIAAHTDTDVEGEGSSVRSSSGTIRKKRENEKGKTTFWGRVGADWWYGGGWLVSVMIVGGVEAVIGGSVVGLM